MSTIFILAQKLHQSKDLERSSPYYILVCTEDSSRIHCLHQKFYNFDSFVIIALETPMWDFSNVYNVRFLLCSIRNSTGYEIYTINATDWMWLPNKSEIVLNKHIRMTWSFLQWHQKFYRFFFLVQCWECRILADVHCVRESYFSVQYFTWKCLNENVWNKPHKWNSFSDFDSNEEFMLHGK